MEARPVGIRSDAEKEELRRQLGDGEGERMLSIRELASRFGCSPDTVYRMIQSGTLPAVQLGGPGHAVRISSADVASILGGSVYRSRSR